MKRIVLCVLILLAYSVYTKAQNVFDPSDPIVRYDKTADYGSATRPDTTIPGLQKWVSTPTIGVSTGTDTFDSRSFKQYFINYKGAKLAFRLKFPYSYNNPDSINKKYPIDMFLHGGGEVGCPTNGGIYNNERPIWLGGKLFRDRVNKNQFDGFLFYPQLVVSDGCFFGWGSAPSTNFTCMIAIIDSLAKYARADIDRLLITGLSGGGYGAWRMADAFPQRVAKIMPSAAAGSTTDRLNFVHIPIWFATGGQDPDPSPEKAQYALTHMQAVGADIRYTIFPERGHACWEQHWREPDFVPMMNDVHKANPLCFFQHNEFCDPNSVDAKLGLTQGFYAYEWSRDGVTIATRVNGINTVLDTSSVKSYAGNEINVKQFGTYRARFKRNVNGSWSDWSPKPVIVKSKLTTQTSPITIKGAHSRVLSAPDGSSTVPLTLPDGFINYRWYNSVDNTLLDTNQVYNAPVGTYRARYDEQFGCGSDLSPVYTVVDANGDPKPSPVVNLVVVPVSKSIVKLDWTQSSGPTDAGSGFEVYRGSNLSGPFTFIKLIAGNILTAKDSSLTPNTSYYYLVRAVNNTGAAAASNTAPVKTIGDNSAPTAPSNLRYTIKSSKSVQLNWNASTDNDGILRYDIFVSGVKLYSTPALTFTVTDLDSTAFYTFVIKAVDSSSNVSPASNQVTVNTKGKVSPYKPGTPASFSATGIAYNKIQLIWSDSTANETGFEIVRSTTSTGTFVPVGTAAANDTMFIDSGLTAAKKYFYKVRAISATGESNFSKVVNATTLAAASTPVAPSKLTAAQAGAAVSLTWVDNSTTEQKYELYRSTDNTNFTLLATLAPNSNAYTDSTATVNGEYYYYVLGVNASGAGEHSNTAQINVGDNAPVINGLTNVFVRSGGSVSQPFTVTDDPGDSFTVTIPEKPAFVTLDKTGTGTYQLNINPTVDNVGTHTLIVIATDNNNKASSDTITITVGDKDSRSVYVNFGSAGKTAPAPWNNWLGTRKAGDAITALKDENNSTTAFTITTINAWTATTNLGHITGDNTGVFPDNVLQSGLADSGDAKQIKISGLNASKQYNLVFVGSQNEGLVATSSYSTGLTQTSVMDSRYNTQTTANLNNLVPDANGEIMVTISRTNSSAYTYLNGMAIVEYDPSVAMLNPENLFVEAINRTTVKLSWSDRTNNENLLDGYELTRATDSLFTKNVTFISLPANTDAYTNSSLLPNTKYWYRVRAKGLMGTSDYSNRAKVITPASIVYVNFNTTVAAAPYPWNSLTAPPLTAFTTDFLFNQSGTKTNITLSLTKEFNGEFTAGVNTGNNSGVVPDNVLQSNYWLDKGQKSQFMVNGLNHTKKYRIGFVGSSSPPNWFKGNYTATYTINNKTVYLNSWENSTKIVYIDGVTPDASGKAALNFSTTTTAGYGFNSGVIIEEYTDTAAESISDPPPIDTIPAPPVDTIPGGNNPPPVDSIPGGNNPPPIDTIPGGGNPPPVDSIPTGNNPPPVDTIPGGGNPPPVDTIPGGNNPPPVDTIPGGGNNPPPVDTTGTGVGNPPPVIDSLSKEINARVYPNPLVNQFKLSFNNTAASNKIMVEIYNSTGVLLYRRDYGQLGTGPNIIQLSGTEAHMRDGLFLVTLKVNGKIAKTTKVIKMRY